MTETDTEGRYPHWKDALFSNDAIANLRCAIDYVIWHAVYGLLALLGLLVIGSIKGARKLSAVLGPVAAPFSGVGSRIISAVTWFVNNDTVSTFFTYLFNLIFYAIVAFNAIVIGLWVYNEPSEFFKFVGIGVSIAAGIIILAAVGIKIRPYLSTAGEKAKETPGVRRVYGECPVDLDISPKWFDNLFPEDE